ncbi:mechanosensitive ion channel family protein [Arthrobacter sp. H14]|uniref:mechanosensitive ion channel family protein n=1 Tax=Arthrobacter sp. H14 TaxID=1312959 RepID=UPI0004AF1C7F|nr:hypothetical protein [Arthrobacter sp. H14]
MTQALSNLWTDVLAFVPKLVLFLVILLIGWLIAKAIAKALDKILEKVGFDRAVERGGIKKALDKSSVDASTIVSKIVFYALMLFVLQLAFGVWGQNPISDLLTELIAWIPLALVAILIIIVASAIAAAVREIIMNTLGGLSYGKLLANIASAFIIGIGIIAALNQMNIAVTVTTPILIAVLATIAGILIVGVGGGLIRPMQSRWEGYLNKAEEEAPKIKEQASSSSGSQPQPADARAREDSGMRQSSGSHPHTTQRDVPPPPPGRYDVGPERDAPPPQERPDGSPGPGGPPRR